MLQSLNSSDQTLWSTGVVDPVVNNFETWRESTRSLRVIDRQGPSVSDVARLYPEAVVASSDDLAWQDIRLIHLRPNLKEIVVPPSDSHCLVLNLSSPLNLRARFGKRNFEGQVLASEVSIIPGCILVLPIPVRTQATLCSVSSTSFCTKCCRGIGHGELVLTPQIGFKTTYRHIAMSLLSEVERGECCRVAFTPIPAFGLAMQLIRRYSSLKTFVGHGGMAPHRLKGDRIDRPSLGRRRGRVALRSIARRWY